jgi:SAM-dependent methyltransferase
MGCVLCEHSNPGFAPCANCGSLPRHRQLAWFVTNKVHLPAGSKVLEIGPAAVQMKYFPRLLREARYTAVDVLPPSGAHALKPPHRFLEMEATRLTFSDQSFELILANNVFPFIRSDYQAMSQVHRCLKGKGLAILDANVSLPKTRKASEMAEENPEYYSEEFRRENGMEWIYGEDYFERLEAAGFFPYRLSVAKLAGEKIAQAQGFSGELILCFKFRDEAEKFLGAL